MIIEKISYLQIMMMKLCHLKGYKYLWKEYELNIELNLQVCINSRNMQTCRKRVPLSLLQNPLVGVKFPGHG